MIHNRNRSCKHLDDLMLQRWENEGGCLGSFAMVDGVSHRDDHLRGVSDAELDLIRSAIDRAMSDDNFLSQLTRRSSRADRGVQWASAT
jgi:hypothetical protein